MNIVRIFMALWRGKFTKAAHPNKSGRDSQLHRAVSRLGETVHREREALDRVKQSREKELVAHHELRCSIAELLRRLEERDHANSHH